MGNERKAPFQLFQRSEGGPYWVRYSIKGQGQIRTALETRDPIEAQHKAMVICGKAIGDAQAGISVRKHPVAKVVGDWCRQLDAEVARGSCKPAKAEQYKGIARRYIAEFWDQKPIDAIDEP